MAKELWLRQNKHGNQGNKMNVNVICSGNIQISQLTTTERGRRKEYST